MSDAVTATYVFDADQWRAAQKAFRSNTKFRVLAAFLFVYFACCVLFATYVILHDGMFTAFPAFILAAGFVTVALPWIRIRMEWSRFKKSTSYNRKSTVTFDGDRLKTSSDAGMADIALSTYTKAEITKEGCLLFIHPRFFIWIPASGFASPADFDTACAAVKANVKKTQDRR